ncbi:MAG TPA: hypothetical protein VMF89_35500 [Polyangiales bacterium]|nr:hypothetical protein [Polyangiales bacterium]
MRGLRQLPVAAAFPYFTKKTAVTDDDKLWQRALYSIKDGGTVRVGSKTLQATDWFVQNYTLDANDKLFFNRTCTLVPMPSSRITPDSPKREHWPSYDICVRLKSNGVAAAAKPLLRRATAVRSSRDARAAGEEAPSVMEHRDSMSTTRAQLQGVDAITLVDDVVSAGRNAMGAYLRLRAEGFRGPITLFAVAYTNYTPGARAPYYGRIVWPEGSHTSSRTNAGIIVPQAGPWSAEPPTAAESAFLA